MTSTLNLQESTVQFINQLVEDSYCEEDIYDFIEQYGENNFVNFYENYVNVGETVGDYNAVDAFVLAFGLDNLDHFEDSYNGEWDTFEDFAQHFFDDVYGHLVPEEISSYIDYDAFAKDLNYDYLIEGNYVFSRNF